MTLICIDIILSIYENIDNILAINNSMEYIGLEEYPMDNIYRDYSILLIIISN